MTCRICGVSIDGQRKGTRYCSKRCKYRARSNSEGRTAQVDFETRYWSKVKKTSICWLWQGRPAVTGYGVIKDPRGRNLYAHRVAWELAHGKPIPEGLTIDHLCRNQLCVNPDHLEPVPMGENTRRAFSPEAHRLAALIQAGHEVTRGLPHTWPTFDPKGM